MRLQYSSSKQTKLSPALEWSSSCINREDYFFYIRIVNKEQNPTATELNDWQRKSNAPIRKFFNISGLLYKSLALKDKLSTMSDVEQLSLLATDGMLVKRPLLITDDKVLVGFKETEWETLK